MRVKKKEYYMVIDYSEFLEFYLQMLENGKQWENFSEKDVNTLKSLIQNNVRDKILATSRRTVFNTHMKISKVHKEDYLQLKKICFFFKDHPRATL